jgi:ketosteroid isomerase-like protein
MQVRKTFLTADQMQIVDTVKTIFAAFLTDDVAMLNTVIAPDSTLTAS